MDWSIYLSVYIYTYINTYIYTYISINFIDFAVNPVGMQDSMEHR